MTKKKILHITTYLQGGAGEIICDLIADQTSRGMEVICVTEESEFSDYLNYPQYVRRLRDMNVELVRVSGLFKRDKESFNRARQTLAGLLAQHSFDLIHSHSGHPSHILLSLLGNDHRKTPLINTMHGWGTNKTASQEANDIHTLSSVDHVVAVSQTGRNLMVEKGVPDGLISVIYNGVKTKSEISQQETLKLTTDTFNIGCIGTVCGRKNQQLLIKALQQLRASEFDFHCVLIGEDQGEYATRMKRYVAEHDLGEHILFTGVLSDASQHLTQFDLLVLPTLSEGLPLTIIEAYRENTLVAASDIPECRELVVERETGFLFDANSVEELAQTIVRISRLSTAEKQSIQTLAHNKYISQFTSDSMLAKYTDLYVTLCKAAGAG